MAIEILPARIPKKKKSHVIEFILIFSIVCLIIAGGLFLYFGYNDYSEMREMKLTWTEIADIANTENPEDTKEFVEFDTSNKNTGVVISSLERKNDMLYRSINLKALREINPDVSGYIYSPNTYIDYPILKEQEPEKYYYLKHDIYNKEDKYGSIFELCDEERGLPELNTAVDMLFGHNMASGAMFAGLAKYKSVAFDKNPIYIYRDDYRIEYMPFASCIVNAHDSVYDFDAFELGNENYQWLLDWLKDKNTVNFTTEFPDVNTKILITSTCNDAYSDIRHIVCFVETRRALVPEYYNSLDDVNQYGGDKNGIENPVEDPDYRQDIIDTDNRNQGHVIH